MRDRNTEQWPLLVEQLPPATRPALAKIFSPTLVPEGSHEAEQQSPSPPQAAVKPVEVKEQLPPPRSAQVPFDNGLRFAEERQWPVFPCDPKNKTPLTSRHKDPCTGEPIKGTGGFKKATRDRDQIKAWRNGALAPNIYTLNSTAPASTAVVPA